jgi:hypothetical protein
MFDRFSRRQFMSALASSTFLSQGGPLAAEQAPPSEVATDDIQLRRRIEGMLVGSLIGDAAGGPVEFRLPEEIVDWMPACRGWDDGRRLTADDLHRLSTSFPLFSYADLRPVPEPYAHWTPSAGPGTVTDDSRHKMILLNALRAAQAEGRLPIGTRDLAAAYVQFPMSTPIAKRPEYAELCRESGLEFNRAARWVLGQRDSDQAAPPQRMWGGLDTCCGQMTLLPLAAIYAGQPSQAYQATYQLGFMDNGPGKDINAALVAGLAFALGAPPLSATPPASTLSERRRSWQCTTAVMNHTDPYRYADIPWVPRPITHWLQFASVVAARAEGQPKRLYRLLEQEADVRYYWEAHFVVALGFSMIEFCDYEPLAALHLLLDFGHDTDSVAQLMGAFIGALHGPEIFPATMRQTVVSRLTADYDQSLPEWVELLLALHAASRVKEVVRLQ